MSQALKNRLKLLQKLRLKSKSVVNLKPGTGTVKAQDIQLSP